MFGTVIARFGRAALLAPGRLQSARTTQAALPMPALREREPGGRPTAPLPRNPATRPAREAPPAPPGHTREMVPLTRLARQATGIVAGVRIGSDPAPAGSADPALERMALRLIEIGFVEGAQLRVIAFGQPGDDPIGVRVGGRGGVSTFALRRREADCIWVWPDRP